MPGKFHVDFIGLLNCHTGNLETTLALGYVPKFTIAMLAKNKVSALLN